MQPGYQGTSLLSCVCIRNKTHFRFTAFINIRDRDHRTNCTYDSFDEHNSGTDVYLKTLRAKDMKVMKLPNFFEIERRVIDLNTLSRLLTSRRRQQKEKKKADEHAWHREAQRKRGLCMRKQAKWRIPPYPELKFDTN